MVKVQSQPSSVFRDRQALAHREPGIQHSFVASLATTVQHLSGACDPIWLMGASTFAFRIVVAENFCPSAMSVFDWSAVLPEAVENAGFSCTYKSRLWDEQEREAACRREAHAAIRDALDAGRPAIVWDIHDHEWGLVIGSDDESQSYEALSHKGQRVTLPYDRLGRNGVDVLSVAIPGEPNARPREVVITNALRVAVAHAEEREWMDRPQYRDGLPAYALWADRYEKGALIIEAGQAGNIGSEMPRFAAYYAAHYYGARCYARDFLRSIAGENRHLAKAAGHYETVAATLRPVWESAIATAAFTDADLCRKLAAQIKTAGEAEAEGIAALREYLSAANA